MAASSPQQHPVEGAALGQEKDGARQSRRHQHPVGGPAGRGHTAHGPAGHLAGCVVCIGLVDQEVGEGPAHRRQGRPCQKQLDRIGTAAEACQEHHRPAGAQSPCKGHAAHKTAPDAQQQGQRGSQGRPRGNAQHIGVGQGVLDNGLHHRSAEGQAGPYRRRQHQAGQADQPDHVVQGSAGAPPLGDGDAGQLVGQLMPQDGIDLSQRQGSGAQAHRRQKGQGQSRPQHGQCGQEGRAAAQPGHQAASSPYIPAAMVRMPSRVRGPAA